MCGLFLESVTYRGGGVRNWLKMKWREMSELETRGQKGVPWRTDPAIDENALFASGDCHVQSYWGGNVTYPIQGYSEGQVDHLVHGYDAARDRDID